MSARPSLDSYFMMMARLAAERATCDRKSVGAVLVRENRQISTGYNGSPPGAPHCTDHGVGCLMADNGEGKVGCIRTVHAEANAIAHAARFGHSTEGSTLYVTLMPCLSCAKIIVSAGVVRVVFCDEYSVRTGMDVLEASNVDIARMRLDGPDFFKHVQGHNLRAYTYCQPVRAET
jgi:dCMP deaminase